MDTDLRESEIDSQAYHLHDAAKRLIVSVSTLRGMISKKLIGHVKIGKKIAVTEQQLSDYLNKHKVNPIN